MCKIRHIIGQFIDALGVLSVRRSVECDRRIKRGQICLHLHRIRRGDRRGKARHRDRKHDTEDHHGKHRREQREPRFAPTPQ